MLDLSMRKVLVCLIAGIMVLVGVVHAMGAAAAADPSWAGDYSLKRFAATKTGTSLAARQSEPDFSDVYRFVSDCAGGDCVATVVDGPAPANPTLPQPPRYLWDGNSWVHHYDWEWDCWQGEGVAKVWAPASSVAYYTPQPDGTLRGTWTTEIFSGPCEGTVTMRVEAYPVSPPQSPRFGS